MWYITYIRTYVTVYLCVCVCTYVHMYVYAYENEMYTCTDTLHYTDNCIMYNSYTHILHYTDNVISSSARRRRKCWSEVEHNESIEELFDRMTSSSAANTAVSLVDMDINSNDDDDDDDEEVVKRVEDGEQNICKGTYV